MDKIVALNHHFLLKPSLQLIRILNPMDLKWYTAVTESGWEKTNIPMITEMQQIYRVQIFKNPFSLPSLPK